MAAVVEAGGCWDGDAGAEPGHFDSDIRDIYLPQKLILFPVKILPYPIYCNVIFLTFLPHMELNEDYLGRTFIFHIFTFPPSFLPFA